MLPHPRPPGNLYHLYASCTFSPTWLAPRQIFVPDPRGLNYPWGCISLPRLPMPSLPSRCAAHLARLLLPKTNAAALASVPTSPAARSSPSG
eukprot:1595833-Pyramimonas_sp.AAC.1